MGHRSFTPVEDLLPPPGPVDGPMTLDKVIEALLFIRDEFGVPGSTLVELPRGETPYVWHVETVRSTGRVAERVVIR